jgi:hypothetical protein
MDIEQQRPNKPNFGLVVAIAGVVMLGIFVVALLTLRWDGKRLVPRHESRHPVSAVVWQVGSNGSAAA